MQADDRTQLQHSSTSSGRVRELKPKRSISHLALFQKVCDFQLKISLFVTKINIKQGTELAEIFKGILNVSKMVCSTTDCSPTGFPQ